MGLDRSTVVRSVEAACELSRRRFAAFYSYANGWHVPEHQKQLASALERVERTPDSRIVIVWPPRHGKSETASIGFPAWCLGRGQAGLGPLEHVPFAAS